MAERAIREGDAAPDFELPDQTGRLVRLRDLLGTRAVVLYFYPKDGTPGCTLEARAFQESQDAFKDAGALVVGVSSDSIPSHRRFAEREGLSFPLLSDRGGAVRALYGVDKTLGVLPGRVTFVIDPTGVVRHVITSQIRIERHRREALGAVRQIGADL